MDARHGRRAEGHAKVLAYLKRVAKSEIEHDAFAPKDLLAATSPVSLGFFAQPTIELARALLGRVLLHGETAGNIVETEAYLGLDDLAAHSARGKTDRTRVIFGPPGHAYVYFIYGMHECLNVVAERDGVPGCVLIRALDPLTGLARMRQRRHWAGRREGLANGPGKLTEALAITREHYGVRLDRGNLAIREWRQRPEFGIEVTPRIGITQCVDWPLRFTWRGHACLSRGASHPTK